MSWRMLADQRPGCRHAGSWRLCGRSSGGQTSAKKRGRRYYCIFFRSQITGVGHSWEAKSLVGLAGLWIYI